MNIRALVAQRPFSNLNCAERQAGRDAALSRLRVKRKDRQMNEAWHTVHAAAHNIAVSARAVFKG